PPHPLHPFPTRRSSDLDVWVLTNANGFGGTPVWIHLAPTGTAPLGRNQPAAVYDAASNRMIVFGGQNGGGAGGATYPEVWVLTRSEEHTSELQSRGHLV